MTDYGCRWPDGTMKLTHHGGRQQLHCPQCQFEYRKAGCLFTPDHTTAAVAKLAQGRGARTTNNSTGGRWRAEDILDRIVEYRARHGEWPDNTTAFRDSQALPHSSTVSRHFGDIAEAVRQAQELYKKEQR